MIRAGIIILSLALYFIMARELIRRRKTYSLGSWPSGGLSRAVWFIWAAFLLLLAPLTYQSIDMYCWTKSIMNLINNMPLQDNYVYLPVYAMLQAAIAFPVVFLGLDARLFLVYVVQMTVLAAYFLTPGIMAAMAPKETEKAPLAIVAAPVTIYYLFFGTNHVVMSLLFVYSLLLLRQKKWVFAGLIAGLSCYKFLMMPVVALLVVMLAAGKGKKETVLFCAGAAVSFLPNVLYYSVDFERFTRTMLNFAALGGHSSEIEEFHFLYFFSKIFPGFSGFYLANRIWMIAVLAGSGIALYLYLARKAGMLASLAVCYGTIALAAPEPFRLEPLAALLWLDGLNRKSRPIQVWVWVMLFAHAFAWFYSANFRNLSFDPSFPVWLWDFRGLVLGITVIGAIIAGLVEKDRTEIMDVAHVTS